MKIILVSHGDFAKGLASSIQMLLGEQEKLYAYGLYPEEENVALKERVEEELKNTSPDEEVIVFSDLFHGSPFNVIVQLMEHYDLYHITGVNLPIMVEVLMKRYADTSAEDICKGVMEISSDTIKNVRALLGEMSRR